MKSLTSPGCCQRIGTSQSQQHGHLQRQLLHCQPSLRLHRAKQHQSRDASQLCNASASSEQPEQQQADALQSSIHSVMQLEDSLQQQQQSHQHLQQDDLLLLARQHQGKNVSPQQVLHAAEKVNHHHQQQHQHQQQQQQQQDVLQHAPPDPNVSQQRHWLMLQRMIAFMVS
jgi:hypothetical protein